MSDRHPVGVVAAPYTAAMPWEPLPNASSGDPVPMTDSLDRVVRRLGGASVDATTGLFARWVELVGEGVARNSRPVSIRGNVLVVAVDDPAWATQLRFLERQLLDRLDAELGAGSVTSIDVRVRPR